MVEELKTKKPASIRVCTLFFKPKAYQRQIPIDYPAMHIGNEFIVGYGLDYGPVGPELQGCLRGDRIVR